VSRMPRCAFFLLCGAAHKTDEGGCLAWPSGPRRVLQRGLQPLLVLPRCLHGGVEKDNEQNRVPQRTPESSLCPRQWRKGVRLSGVSRSSRQPGGDAHRSFPGMDRGPGAILTAAGGWSMLAGMPRGACLQTGRMRGGQSPDREASFSSASSFFSSALCIMVLWRTVSVAWPGQEKHASP